MKQALVQRTEFMFTRQRVETIAHDTPSEAEVFVAYCLFPLPTTRLIQ
jgi:hypothetical protein